MNRYQSSYPAVHFLSPTGQTKGNLRITPLPPVHLLSTSTSAWVSGVTNSSSSFYPVPNFPSSPAFVFLWVITKIITSHDKLLFYWQISLFLLSAGRNHSISTDWVLSTIKTVFWQQPECKAIFQREHLIKVWRDFKWLVGMESLG